MQVLHHLTHGMVQPQDPNLLVGLDMADDAAVYRISAEQAVVLTVDFFAPVVDDPYTYGAVSAANAMSDVYAMGGEPVIALNISAFPDDIPPEAIAQILRGGAEKVSEAGAIIVGGHTIYDPEPKYGLCVMGLVHPDRVLTKGGALLGDLLYLTKALGTGIITTAGKAGAAVASDLESVNKSMLKLNRDAARAFREVGVRALTDVTGFGLLGHGYEMASAGGAGFAIHAGRVPLLPGARRYAGQGVSTGGEERNRAYLEDKVQIVESIPSDLEAVLYDPQTSGGLLAAVDREKAAELERRFAKDGLDLWQIGEVVDGPGISVFS